MATQLLAYSTHGAMQDVHIAFAFSKLNRPVTLKTAPKPNMQVIVTAVGPDNRGLADPIIHHLTGRGANIAEIQMYDHDEQSVFAMLLRIEIPDKVWGSLRGELAQIGRLKGLSIRVWSPDERTLQMISETRKIPPYPVEEIAKMGVND